MQKSGGFASDNPHAAASLQPSAGSNANNVDTSNATRLAPAVDAEAREAQEEWSETSQLNASRGLRDSEIETGNHENVIGGYAGAADLARAPGEFKPKGKNITEGGFDSSAPNASFNNTEIGSKKDPGRVAEAKFQRENAQVAGAIGKQKGDIEESGFEALKRDEEA